MNVPDEGVRDDAPLDAALARWRAELREVTRNDGDDAPRLTMSQAHPGGLAQLFTDHPTRLSLLIREPASLARAIERARLILARSRDLAARHGVGRIHMSIGQARWTEDGQARTSGALLRPARLIESDTDVSILLEPGCDLDPDLAEALAAHGVAIDAQDLVERATTIRGFSSSQALAELRAAGAVLDEFELRDDLLLGIFEHPASRLEREFANPQHIFTSPLVRALADSEDAIARMREPLPAVDPTDRDPWKERGVGDLTPRQQDVVEAVAKGRSFLVDVPHGADGTGLVTAILADAGASGRQTLHIAGSPSRTTKAQDRLTELGLSEMFARLDATTAGGEDLRDTLRAALVNTESVIDPYEVDRMRTRLRDTRAALASHTARLHRPFRNFGVSAFDALQVLTDLTSAHPSPATRVRLREETLLGIAMDQGARARTLLHEASRLGIFTRTTTHAAWKGAVINSEEQVPDVLARVNRLAKESLPELRVRMGAVAGETEITPAATLGEWESQLSMFEGVRDVLDVFTAEIFERSAADLVIATASKQWRTAHGITMKRSERIRLVKRAQDFVRPGTHVEDLHRELIKVQERREAWRERCSQDGWPIVPQRLDEAVELTHQVSADLERLKPFFSTAHPNFSAMPIRELARLFEALAADPEGARELPQRITVLKELGTIGLADLANDLRARHVAENLIDAEVDLAWWASILGLMLAHEPELGGFDPSTLESTLAEGRRLDALQIDTLAPQALSQLRRLRLQAIAARSDQREILERALFGKADAVELFTSIPLVRHLVPVIFTVPTLVPSLIPAGHRFDVLVLDDIEGLPLPELVPIIARAKQVVVVADLSSASPTGASESLAAVLPTVRMDVSPSRLNDQVAMLLARYGVDHAGVPVPWTAAIAPVTAVWPDGSGMPAPGAHAVESTGAEVDAVVDLVVAHAVEQPERSLAVIALNERHAERLATALQRTRASEPGLASFFDSASAEPFVVVDAAGAHGLSRDRIIISVGFAKTPHGRVIHDFGDLSSPQGATLMADVLRSVRGDLTLVSSLRPDQLDRSRLSSSGALMLADLLSIGEGQSGLGMGAWPVLEAEPDRLLVDLADRLYGMGLEVVPNVGIPGGMRIPLAIGHPEVPGRLLVAVLTDDDDYVAEPSVRVRDRLWPAMLEAQGWKVHTALSMAVFIDPGAEAEAIVEKVLDAVDEANGTPEVVAVPDRVEDDEGEIGGLEALIDERPGEESKGPEADFDASVAIDELVESTSQVRERVDALTADLAEERALEAEAASVAAGRAARPNIAAGLPLAAYSDDQLDDMAMWVRSDGIERTNEELVDELREALGITRRGFQSDAVLGNVVRRTGARVENELESTEGE